MTIQELIDKLTDLTTKGGVRSDMEIVTESHCCYVYIENVVVENGVALLIDEYGVEDRTS